MGVNATAIVSKIRVTAPVANTLERLLKDGEKAKALVSKLEEELLGDDDEVKPETETDEAEPSFPGLREKGSVLVDETIARVLGKQKLEGEELEESQRIQKVGVGFMSLEIANFANCVGQNHA